MSKNIISSIFGQPVDRASAEVYADGAQTYMSAHLGRIVELINGIRVYTHDDIIEIHAALKRGTITGKDRAEAALRMLAWLGLFRPFEPDTLYVNVDDAMAAVWEDINVGMRFATLVISTPTTAIYSRFLAADPMKAAEYLKHSMFVASFTRDGNNGSVEYAV